MNTPRVVFAIISAIVGAITVAAVLIFVSGPHGPWTSSPVALFFPGCLLWWGLPLGIGAGSGALVGMRIYDYWHKKRLPNGE